MLFLAAARACILPAPSPPKPTAPRLPPLAPFNHRRRPARLLLRPVTRAAAPRPPPPPAPSSRPARDRVIEFGKHRGQMLGTLPPPYLRWVAAELDYGETAPWAALAREVLGDPVYVDRAEWDHAHRFLRGDSEFDYAYDDDAGGDGPLQEMAERFGWDLADEEGWARLDLRLLGTSFGGRIPRKGARSQTGGGRTASSAASGRKERSLFDDAGADRDGPRGKRDERRERMRTKREEQVRAAKMGMLGVTPTAAAADGGALGTPRKVARIRTAKKEILGLGRGARGGEMLGEKRTIAGKGGQGGSPFPGRQAFLDKVRKLKGDDDS